MKQQRGGIPRIQDTQAVNLKTHTFGVCLGSRVVLRFSIRGARLMFRHKRLRNKDFKLLHAAALRYIERRGHGKKGAFTTKKNGYVNLPTEPMKLSHGLPYDETDDPPSGIGADDAAADEEDEEGDAEEEDDDEEDDVAGPSKGTPKSVAGPSKGTTPKGVAGPSKGTTPKSVAGPSKGTTPKSVAGQSRSTAGLSSKIIAETPKGAGTKRGLDDDDGQNDDGHDVDGGRRRRRKEHGDGRQEHGDGRQEHGVILSGVARWSEAHPEERLLSALCCANLQNSPDRERRIVQMHTVMIYIRPKYAEDDAFGDLLSQVAQFVRDHVLL